MTTADILQSIHDSSNRQFGISPDCPIRVTTVFASYPYLERLHRKDGKEFTYDRLGSMDGPSGHILDKWVFKWKGGETAFYVDCYSRSASMCAPAGWFLVPGDEDEPWISSTHQPLSPATWDSDDLGEAWDFGNSIAIFQSNPRTMVEKICQSGMAHSSYVDDPQGLLKQLPNFIKYPFVLQFFYKPGLSPGGQDSKRPHLALVVKQLFHSNDKQPIRLALCEFNSAGQSIHQELAALPSREVARQLFFEHVKTRFPAIPKYLGPMKIGYEILYSKKAPTTCAEKNNNAQSIPTKTKHESLGGQSLVLPNESDSPPSIDSSLLTPRLRPLTPTEKTSTPSPVSSATSPHGFGASAAASCGSNSGPPHPPISQKSETTSQKTPSPAHAGKTAGDTSQHRVNEPEKTNVTEGENGMKTFLWLILIVSLVLNIVQFATHTSGNNNAPQWRDMKAISVELSNRMTTVETTLRTSMNEIKRLQSEAVKGYEEGKAQGYSHGFTEGEKKGKTEGYQAGLAKGREAGPSTTRAPTASGQAMPTKPQASQIKVGSNTKGEDLLKWFGNPIKVVELPIKGIHARARWDYPRISFVMEEDYSGNFRVVSWEGDLDGLIRNAGR